MGFNKALAPLAAPGSPKAITLIERTVDLVSQLSPEVIVVANEVAAFRALGLRVVTDNFPGRGSLGGVYSGLLAASRQHALVVACDMPFLSLPLWRYMLELPRDYDVLIPRVGQHFEPLHAIYSRSCIEPIKKQIEENNLQIIQLLRQSRVRYVDEPEIDQFDPTRRSFLNVNTPQDWAEATAILGQQPQTPNPES
jgi:molybdopterin-guanine dinucleotide biosynthesis protein A